MRATVQSLKPIRPTRLALQMTEIQPTSDARERGRVIGIPIDALSWDDARSRLMSWASSRASKYVAICNVHSVVTATQDADFRRVIEQADMATPDGAPVAWTLRRKGFRGQPRLNGPDLMWRLCADAQSSGIGIGLYGSSPATLSKLEQVLRSSFPRLSIGYSVSPPFRALSVEEDEAACREINASGIGLLFVGLGCPKQEHWMAAHRGRLQAVMLGVGAAFDYHAGTISRAPPWMRSAGLEWFHRLCAEPKRLWRRYLFTNARFLAASSIDLIRSTWQGIGNRFGR